MDFLDPPPLSRFDGATLSDFVILLLLCVINPWLIIVLGTKACEDFWKCTESQYPSLNQVLWFPRFCYQICFTLREAYNRYKQHRQKFGRRKLV